MPLRDALDREHRRFAGVPRIVVHPRNVDDNLGLYALLGGVFDRDAEAARLAADFSAAREELAALAATLPRETALYLIWREPWMTVRRDTYISSMLAAAGWDTLPEQAAVGFHEFSWDESWLAALRRQLA